jgi:Mrp family chromosome partitioning ATPase
MSMLATFRSSTGGGAVSVPSVGGGHGDQTNDEFRLIKWHFLAQANTAAAEGKNPRVILITSAGSGEGKSYVAHHLAANFALDPHVELTLIDANFDNPALGSSSWMGGGVGGAGLLDYLESGSDSTNIVKSTGMSNVRVILPGSTREHAPELIANGRLEGLLASLTTSTNSFVIIDAGPVLADGSAAILARYAGHIAFVVAANSTSRSDITQGLATLDRIAGPIDEKAIGLIFN